MTNSTAAQHRIMAAFPKMSKWADYELVLSVLVSFFEGEKIRVFFGNDAPRGGAVGDYFQCFRKSAAAAAFFRELLAEAKAK